MLYNVKQKLFTGKLLLVYHVVGELHHVKYRLVLVHLCLQVPEKDIVGIFLPSV